MNITIDSKTFQRFIEKIDLDGPIPDQENSHYHGLGRCWQWKARSNSSGYGRLMVDLNGKRFTARAHRISWQILIGAIPEGKMVLHRCDNPKCVNPGHLFIGDAKANSDDKIKKGRADFLRGGPRRRPSAGVVLTEDQVREIRRAYMDDGISGPKLAKQFGISRAMVSLIVLRKAWKLTV